MRKLIWLLIILLLSGCGPAYYYPAGATEFQKWQIDTYYEQQWQNSVNSFRPQRSQNCSYLNGLLYCW